MKKKKGSEKDKENAGCGEKSTRGLVWTEEDEEEERLRKAVYAYRKNYQLKQKWKQGQKKELWQKRSYKKPIVESGGGCPVLRTTNWRSIEMLRIIKKEKK